jgi:hypothetical protein
MNILNVQSWIQFVRIRDEIPDPTTTIKRRAKKFVVLPIFVVITFTKLEIILFLNRYRTKYGPIDKGLKVFFTRKIVTKIEEIWVGD